MEDFRCLDSAVVEQLQIHQFDVFGYLGLFIRYSLACGRSTVLLENTFFFPLFPWPLTEFSFILLAKKVPISLKRPPIRSIHPLQRWRWVKEKGMGATNWCFVLDLIRLGSLQQPLFVFVIVRSAPWIQCYVLSYYCLWQTVCWLPQGCADDCLKRLVRFVAFYG